MQNSINKQFSEKQISEFFDSITIEDENRVAQYLKEGMSPNVVSATEKTALQAALFEGSVDIALLLIDSGAECRGPGLLGGSLIHDASWSNLLVKRLLSKGADPHTIDVAGYDTVFSAANNTSMKSVEVLANCGCPLDRKFEFDNGKQAIHAAAHHHDEDVVATFVRLGVPATSVDNEGSTVIHYSVKSNYVSALNITGDRNAFISSMKSLGVDIDAQDIHGKTALHYAAEMRNPEIAKALLINGARADICDRSGLSAFDVASESVKPILASVVAKNTVDDLLVRVRGRKPHP